MKAFKTLSVISTLITFILITFGAFVRLKGAGLACPDWPLCYGKIIPPPGFQIALEVGHRFLATLLGVILICMTIISLRLNKLKKYNRLVLIVLLVVIFQGVLGGATVIFALHPVSVVLHLIFGNLTLMLLVFLSLKLFVQNQQKENQKRYKQTLVMITVFFIILISGGANSSTYSGYSCTAFPLCLPGDPFSFSVTISSEEISAENNVPENADRFIDEYGKNSWIHMIHRIVSILGGISLIVYAFRLKTQTQHLLPNILPNLLIFLILAEVGVGIINALYKVPVPVSALHTMIASLIATVLTGFLFFTGRR